ncbi:MAG: hypothetical protein QNJ15_00875 [Erythrobacter sp.]|nr:hypothetical protein [Erythrobacter sp.]
MNDIKPQDDKPEDEQDLLEDAKSEISEMAKDGASHPSTKPVLIGAAIGVVVGVVAFNGAWFLGLLVGAAIALYMRIKK